jgi:hypothetical protein
MDVLTTRELQYLDDHGDERIVLLTIFAPWERVTEGDWRGAFAFGPPIARLNGKTIPSGGVDFIQCFMGAVEVARGYLMGSHLAERAHWQGMRECGLPWHVERPADYQPPDIGSALENPGNLEVLATRSVGCPDSQGITRALQFTIYKPLQMADGVWHCAFSFGSEDDKLPPVRYGAGADFIESFLDALALARATYQTMVPEGWDTSQSDTLLGCLGFPYKIGRAFFTEPAKPFPGMPDFFPAS